MNEHIRSLRREYALETLTEQEVDKSPFLQFKGWFEEALKADIEEPNAMNIATVSSSGIPSSRIVLMRGFDENGIVFYNNYNSKKSNDIKGNPNVSLHFFWQPLQRQVRIQGTAVLQTAEESDAYFLSRPRESQLGAWASAQSDRIISREELDASYKKFEDEFKTKELKRPAFWGGWVIKPNYFEFWQGRVSRLHDRICYQKEETGAWSIFRVAP
jgi:pyridoxamine 5'-phosphate oxidase